ncbi:L,D-transpeptidase family protein [Kaarinaea lacus]
MSTWKYTDLKILLFLSVVSLSSLYCAYTERPREKVTVKPQPDTSRPAGDIDTVLPADGIGQRYPIPDSEKHTVASAVQTYGIPAELELISAFDNAGLEYPPKSIKMLAMKAERRMELWASEGSGYRYIKSYNILGASGSAGPKLVEGDMQVPEGVYQIVFLNPNSSYHLSMQLNYPNAFDLHYAKQEGRQKPGSNIFIHGSDVSAGCLAIGDNAIEELFTLVYRIGKSHAEVIIAPHDPRIRQLSMAANTPNWLPRLYKRIAAEFNKYRHYDS